MGFKKKKSTTKGACGIPVGLVVSASAIVLVKWAPTVSLQSNYRVFKRNGIDPRLKEGTFHS